MFTISSKQINLLDEIFKNIFIIKVEQILVNDFSNEGKVLIKDKIKLHMFINRSIQKAYEYHITKEESIIGFIILNFLNGENFLDTSDFAVYKYYLKRKMYDPNKYIFEIPNKNQ